MAEYGKKKSFEKYVEVAEIHFYTFYTSSVMGLVLRSSHIKSFLLKIIVVIVVFIVVFDIL